MTYPSPHRFWVRAAPFPDAARAVIIEHVVESVPLSCPAGHVLSAGQVLAGWWACGCPGARHGGHRTWTCRRCMEAGVSRDECVILDGRHESSADVAQRGPDLQRPAR